MEYPKDGKCKNCGAMLPQTFGKCICGFCKTEYVMQMDKPIDAVVEANPGKAILLCEKADSAYEKNRIGEAISYLNEALKYDQSNYAIWTKMGRAHRLANNLVRARECYQRALSIKPNAIEVIANLGVLEISCNNYQLAYKYCKQAYEAGSINPADNAIYAANYALTTAKIGNKKEALKILKIARKRGYENYSTISQIIKES